MYDCTQCKLKLHPVRRLSRAERYEQCSRHRYDSICMYYNIYIYIYIYVLLQVRYIIFLLIDN